MASQSPAWKELQTMIGLDEIKATLQALFDRVHTNYGRELQEKEPIQITLNRVFLGPPGTGKTTVAQLYGRILADLGLLSSGEVVIKNPSDFVAPYLGQSEERTKDIIEASEGKVLVIDDAHMLYNGNQSDTRDKSDVYRLAVIDTLVAEVQNVPGEDRCIILIGYPEQMEELFQNSSPGLARRFPLEEAFRFENFGDDQLGRILDLKLDEQELSISPGARQVALEMLGRARDRPNFGNGGDVENLLSKAKIAYQKRISKTATIGMPEDIVLQPQDFDANHDRALRASEKCRSLFSDLIGCEDIIARFEGYQQTVAGMQLHGVDPRPYIPFTFLFKGPPGTGKTTTARKVGQIFYDMGFLSYPEIIECSVSDLIARYTGQTGPKVVKLLERALGKVLFIDEAYRLTDGEYAKEAVGELVDCLTKKRFEHKIVIVLAGYKEDIDKLMLANRGLRSRFATEVIFRHMRPEQSLKLLQQTVGKEGITIDGVDQQRTDARHRIVGLFEKLTRVVLWANGRDVKALGARIIVQMFQARGRDPNATRELIFTADNLTRMLESRLDDLEILQSEMAVSAAPEDHPDRGAMLNDHGIRLLSRYKRIGNMDDLETAISHTRQAVSATSEDHPNRAKWLGTLGRQLCARYERIGNIDDLESAISNTQEAVSATSQDHADYWLLNNLGGFLTRRYERTGNIDDLNIAISNTQQAVCATPEDYPDRAIILNNLGGFLMSRYERTGNVDDLEVAISNTQQAVSAIPEDHLDRAGCLNNLGNRLLRRYERTGNMEDLEVAISNAQQAVCATPEDHPDRPGRLNSLGCQLESRYKRTGNMEDLEVAISNTQQAVYATPEDHPSRVMMLSSLGSQLTSRYEQTGNVDDLEVAISNTQQAICATPEDHPSRAGRPNDLGLQLWRRYERTGNMDDLKAAISNTQQAVSVIPEDHPDRVIMLSSLGLQL